MGRRHKSQVEVKAKVKSKIKAGVEEDLKTFNRGITQID
jgi:hypothetical protein